MRKHINYALSLLLGVPSLAFATPPNFTQQVTASEQVQAQIASSHYSAISTTGTTAASVSNPPPIGSASITQTLNVTTTPPTTPPAPH